MYACNKAVAIVRGFKPAFKPEYLRASAANVFFLGGRRHHSSEIPPFVPSHEQVKFCCEIKSK